MISDTTGAITGGLAGIYYGWESIPEYWVTSLARMEDIWQLVGKLNNKYSD
jgi:ADP-ribosyl-[dinitrogen reductase] hydrolase